jgi:hypothetical protein
MTRSRVRSILPHHRRLWDGAGHAPDVSTRLVAVIIVPVRTWGTVWRPIHSAHFQKAAKKPPYSSQGTTRWVLARSKEVGHGEPSVYDLPSWLSLYLNKETRNGAIWATPCDIPAQDVDVDRERGHRKLNARWEITESPRRCSSNSSPLLFRLGQ